MAFIELTRRRYSEQRFSKQRWRWPSSNKVPDAIHHVSSAEASRLRHQR